MKLSIIIPIYNGEVFLERLMQTINKFTFYDFECIFIDNNSTDNSLATLKGLVKNTSIDYLILSEEKQGAGHARNTGIKYAKGEYLAFLDCDDIILPGKFERDMEIFSNHDVDFVFCRAKRIYDNGFTLKHPIEGIKEAINEPPNLGYVWIQNYFKLPGPGSLVAKREVINILGGFNTSLTGEDAFLFIQLGLQFKGFFYDEVFFQYMRHRDSTITRSNKKENGSLKRYLELRKNLYSDSLIMNYKPAKEFLENQINKDLFKLHSSGNKIEEHLSDLKLKDFRPNLLLFNPISLLINKIVSDIKFNPFFQVYTRLNK